MNIKWNILLAGALMISLTACSSTSSRRQIVTAKVLRKGMVTGAALATDEYPRHRQHIWTSDNPQHGCDVTISYRGTDQCQAHLEYVSPEDKPPVSSASSQPPAHNTVMFLPVLPPFNPTASRQAGARGATITLQNVTDVRLVCGDEAYPQFDECLYTIEEVDCSRSADQTYLVHKTDASLKHVEMPCYTKKTVVWSGAKPCNVTALLKGSAFAPARVWTSDVKGNVIGFQFAGAQPTFVTFRDISKLEMECGSSSDKAGGNCDLDIIQTECDK
jgi:hypothetical protein